MQEIGTNPTYNKNEPWVFKCAYKTKYLLQGTKEKVKWKYTTDILVSRWASNSKYFQQTKNLWNKFLGLSFVISGIRLPLGHTFISFKHRTQANTCTFPHWILHVDMRRAQLDLVQKKCAYRIPSSIYLSSKILFYHSLGNSIKELVLGS